MKKSSLFMRKNKKRNEKMRFLALGLISIWILCLLLAPAPPVKAANDLTINASGSPLPAVVGKAWAMSFSASGGTAPYTCSASAPLPPGITFNASACTLSGTPSASGSYPVQITFTDSADPQNSGQTTLNFSAVQVTLTTRSTHPSGTITAGFPVWVHARFSLDRAGGLPFTTLNVTTGSGGPTCTLDLDDSGEGECALIFPAAGTRTVEVNFTEGDHSGLSAGSIAISIAPLNVTPALSAGRNHTCYLDANGIMTCWGLADAYPADKNNPPLPQGTFTQISSGDYQTCGLKVDGTIACWGENTDVTQNVPTGQFVAVSAGDEYVCAIDTRSRLTCWGSLTPALANWPQIKVESVSAGSSTTCAIQKNNHQPICWGSITTAPQTAVSALAVGNTHACAVKADGSLTCWGTPNLTPPAGTSFMAIGSGSDYSCARQSDGKLACWGSNAPPVDTSAAYETFSSGFLHTCALKPNGTGSSLACWGNNNYGKAPRITLSPDQLPEYLVNGKPFSQTFTAEGGNAPYTVSLASGSLPPGLALANTPDGYTLSGTLTTPGSSSFTLSAAETFPGSSLPLPLTPTLKTYTTNVIDGTTSITLTLTPGVVNAGSPVSAKAVVTTAPGGPAVSGFVEITSADGDAQCRVEINAGAAECALYFSLPGQKTVTAVYEGSEYYESSTSSAEIQVNAVSISPTIGAGNQYSCSIDGEGKLNCWGKVSGFQRPTPTTGGFVQLDLANAHACAVGLNRKVTCWGWNGYNMADYAVQLSNIKKVTTGSTHTCALTAAGEVVCWGNPEASNVRLKVPSLGSGRTYQDVDAGADHTCAVVDDGSVRCWGVSAADGRMDVPSDLTSRGKVTKISSGDTFTCALHENGALECWGGVGVADAIRNEQPAGLFTDVSAGKDFACALKTDGSAVCWGSLTSAPEGTFTRIAAGSNHACGILAGGGLQCWGDNSAGQAPAISLTPDQLPVIDAGKPWQTPIRATGGRVTQYAYQISSGALPAGLHLDSNTGLLSGTPSQAGVFTFSVRAQEASLTPATASSHSYQLTVRGWADAAIDSALPAGAVVGRPVRVTFSVRPRPGYEMSAAPGGKVTVSAEGNQCEVELNGGTGSCDMLFSAPGIKKITITYPGDGLYQPGDSGSLEYEALPFSQPVKLVTGQQHTYIYRSDGTVDCIGSGCKLSGQFTRLDTGSSFDCGLRANGTIACEAANGPTPVFNNGPYIEISVGEAHACALKMDGSVECQGENGLGQATPPAGRFTALSAGSGHTCALQEDGQAVCWGKISLPPAGAFTHLVSGSEHTCGLHPDGSITCWGAEGIGQVHLPASPVAFTQIATGGAQTCGLDPDGKAHCWTWDAPDQIQTVPGKFIALTVGDDHGCALHDGLKLTCWGEDDAGEAPQIYVDRLTQEQIPALAYFEHVFNATGGVKPLSAAVVEGQLPPGMAWKSQAVSHGAITPQDLSPAGMVLYGTPTQPGVYPFTIRWTDVSPYPLVMQQSYTLTVTGADLKVQLNPYSAAQALQGMDYRFQAVVTNQSVFAVPNGVVLTIQLPEGMQDIRADLPACKLSGSKLTCPLGALDPTAPKAVWVTGKVGLQSGQTMQLSASVASTLAQWPELNDADNTASFTVGVTHRADFFSDNFEQGQSPDWTGGTRLTAPNGQAILSGDDILHLNLNGLPDHKKLIISFDLYVIGGWQGQEWLFGIAGEPDLLHTSFSNDPAYRQAYPGGLPGSSYPAREGRAALDELGFEHGGSPLADARYQMTFTVPHQADAVQLVFQALNLPDGAMWALDNFNIKVDTGMTQLWLPLVSVR